MPVSQRSTEIDTRLIPSFVSRPADRADTTAMEFGLPRWGSARALTPRVFGKLARPFDDVIFPIGERDFILMADDAAAH